MSENGSLDQAASGSSTTGSVAFVDWVPGEKVTTSRTPRTAHKKSRTGCQRCRTRRVKCDEVFPICGGCQKHKASCIRPTNPSITDASLPNSVDSGVRKLVAENSTKIPEKETRRQLELRLMLQWATKTAATIPGWIYPSVREFLLGPYTELAIKNDALLYAIYAWTALHAATMSTESGREWAMDVYRTYLDLALQQHQVDIANLGKDNANVVCVTTTHLRQCIQTTLQDRIIDPYLPPVEWLHMTRGCADVFKTAWEWIGDDDTSIALHFIQRKPDMSDDSVLFNAANGEDLKYIMRRSCCEELDEPWDSEIEATYLAAIRYLGGARKAFEDKDANFDVICRWVMGFPMKMERRFVELVEEQRPRAMVVLAHYFALLSKLRDVWWVGDTGRREVRGIAETLPTDWIWLDMMTWPLNTIYEEPMTIKGLPL